MPNVLINLMLTVIAATLISGTAEAGDERRLALVITNLEYTSSPDIGKLTYAHEDGEAVSTALREAGFDLPRTRVIRDANNTEMRSAVERFGKELERAATEVGPTGKVIAFFYYSGHGAADDAKRNFAIPVKEPIATTQDLTNRGVALDWITERILRTRAWSFIVFDACRNVLRGPFKGLTPSVENLEIKQRGALVAYSAPEGKTINDDHLYAEVLAKHLRTKPGTNHVTMFQDVGFEIYRRTGQQRYPLWIPDMFGEFVYFQSPADVTVARDVPPLPSPQDRKLGWTVRSVADAAIYFPNVTQMFSGATPLAAQLGQLAQGTRLQNRKVETVDADTGIWLRFINDSGDTAFVRRETAVLG